MGNRKEEILIVALHLFARGGYEAVSVSQIAGELTINALAASDEVLIPVEASYLPIKGLQQLLKTIGKVRKQINPKLQVGGILFTMVDAHTNDARNNMELLRNVYGSQIHIFDNYIPFSVGMKEAVREGQSIFSYDPKGKATEAYRRVTEEVLKDAIQNRLLQRLKTKTEECNSR